MLCLRTAVYSHSRQLKTVFGPAHHTFPRLVPLIFRLEMPPKRTQATNGSSNAKRKAENPPDDEPDKKVAKSKDINNKYSEDDEFVLRKFYPPEMSYERAKEYKEGNRTLPIQELEEAVRSTQSDRDNIKVRGSIVHWFKCDLRTQDNTGLFLASKKAREAKVPVIGLYIVSPEDFEAHNTSASRVDFILRTLKVLKDELAKSDIPLYVETVDVRKNIPKRIIELADDWKASHIFANVEYEVDELRREAGLIHRCLKNDICFTPLPDTCVIAPGELSSGSGSQYAVYTPWYRSWMKYIQEHNNSLNLRDAPSKNPSSARKDYKKVFDSKIPSAPKNREMPAEKLKRFGAMWPAGEHEAQARLAKFIKQNVKDYADNRNFPGTEGTSRLSVHLAAGTISARQIVKAVHDSSNSNKLDGGGNGKSTYISEVAWRDFYKHIMVRWPYVVMNVPFKPEYTRIKWEYDNERLQAWKEGRTGFPIVDAAMRQLVKTGWMHNRCRMIVASFLAKDLMLDWRLGERFFMLHLIDGDFASNNGGWGFSSSTGADPQPYFRIFNPLLQSEKFDPDGEYIREYVPELKDVEGKAIHDPWGRGSATQIQKTGYPKPIVQHSKMRELALSRYKEATGK